MKRIIFRLEREWSYYKREGIFQDFFLIAKQIYDSAIAEYLLTEYIRPFPSFSNDFKLSTHFCKKGLDIDDYLFAFLNETDLRDFCNDEMTEVLSAMNAQVCIYECDNTHVVEGNYQLVFFKESARLIKEIPVAQFIKSLAKSAA